MEIKPSIFLFHKFSQSAPYPWTLIFIMNNTRDLEGTWGVHLILRKCCLTLPFFPPVAWDFLIWYHLSSVSQQPNLISELQHYLDLKEPGDAGPISLPKLWVVESITFGFSSSWLPQLLVNWTSCQAPFILPYSLPNPIIYKKFFGGTKFKQQA